MFPILLCTTKFAQNRSNTTVHDKTCTEHFRIKLAQITSQYYCKLQSSHKTLPNTTIFLQNLYKTLPNITFYYKACAKSFPILLYITKLAQSTSQYYCIRQILHKALPSTIVNYKACIKQTRHFAASPINMATCRDQKTRGFATSPINTAISM